MDGFINPADLMSPSSSQRDSGHFEDSNSRGVKRSRSPGNDGNDIETNAVDGADNDDDKPRKRGKSGKPTKYSPSPPKTVIPTSDSVLSSTPQLKNQHLPQASPSRNSPVKITPVSNNKGVKYIAPVRDHTTDQLTSGGDDYVERDHDKAGETKVTATGHLIDGREYRCRTFFVPGRGEKLFMLATECARVLVFRDSYLLFNKNKSLHKIIASQLEKEDLIKQEILPYAYRSRQIAIVTARSMFRQFGARMIVDGRRVKDDYWEENAISQGFTEEDFAIERKVVEKAKPAKDINNPTTGGTDISSTGQTAMNTLMRCEIVYEDLPNGVTAPAVTPMEVCRGGGGSVIRPRQELTGAPYEDKSQPSTASEIINQAAQASQSNAGQAEGRKHRDRFYGEFYVKERKVVQMPQLAPAPSPRHVEHQQQQLPPAYNQSPQQQRRPSQPIQIPQQHQAMMNNAAQMYGNSGAFARLQSIQNSMQPSSQAMRPDQMHTPNSMPQMGNHQRGPNFFKPGTQMGLPSTPTPGGNAGGMPQFYGNNSMWPSQQASAVAVQQQHMNQSQSPLNIGGHHPNQQQHLNFPLGHMQNPTSMGMSSAGYPNMMGMAGAGGIPQGYPQLGGRSLYPGNMGPGQPGFMQGGMASLGMNNMGLSHMGQPGMGGYIAGQGGGVSQSQAQSMMPGWNGMSGPGF